jgi:hypothetical protein
MIRTNPVSYFKILEGKISEKKAEQLFGFVIGTVYLSSSKTMVYSILLILLSLIPFLAQFITLTAI